ncbi:MAG: methylmalonyl-CoA mutase family protein [Thermoplasmata archaeon]
MTSQDRDRQDVSRSHRRWEENTYRQSSHAREDEEAFETLSGIPTRACYAPDDLSSWDYMKKSGFPGEYPYTRGIHPTMYRGRLWTMRQYAGFGTAEETNARFRYLLSQGQTGLSVAFDLPTQIGFDSDSSRASGEVGRVGVAIASVEDMEVLLREIRLDSVSTSMTINATAMILLSLYGLVGESQGVHLKSLQGTVQNDILKEYAARGTYIYPIEPAMKLTTDIIEWCSGEMPRWNTISISGYHMREAGCTAVQEVAFTMANAIAYMDYLVERGLTVDSFAPRLSFFFAAQMDLFEEVAKFRAARRMWARIMKERFSAKDPRSWLMRFHTQTAGVSLTAQQPENNAVRVAIQALAAILGGTQSLHTNSMDEALSLPTERSALLALRTQQILAHESGIVNIVDPTAGSFYVENLTDEIEERAERYIRRIDQLGGTLRALERGFIQREIADEAYRHQKEVETGRRVIIGVNEFVEDAPPAIHITRIDPTLEEKQVKRLGELKARRDSQEAEGRLTSLKEAADMGENLVPYVLKAARSHATLGEISDALREVYGLFRQLREF